MSRCSSLKGRWPAVRFVGIGRKRTKKGRRVIELPFITFQEPFKLLSGKAGMLVEWHDAPSKREAENVAA